MCQDVSGGRGGAAGASGTTLLDITLSILRESLYASTGGQCDRSGDEGRVDARAQADAGRRTHVGGVKMCLCVTWGRNDEK